MVIVWRITELCNLACPFCAYDRRVSRTRETVATSAVLRFARVLSEWQSETGDRVLLSWLGGEPLLWPALGPVSVACHDLGLSLSVTTNGTALERAEKRILLSERFAEVTISVDALHERHDVLRSWPGGFASLAKSVALLAETKRRTGKGPRLRANVVLMHQTWSSFPELCDELSQWGIEEISFNQLGGNDRPEYFPAHRLTEGDAIGFAAALGPLRRKLNERGVNLVGGDGYLRRISASSRGERLAVDNCNPGRTFLFIDERGRVSPCNFTSGTHGIALETLQSVADLRALPHRFDEDRRSRRPAACEDCHSTQVCEKFSPALT